jgi:trk system potassium uptake protein TrkA
MPDIKKIPLKSRSIVIIERDYGLCKELSSRFPKALVLNEDISDESFIAEQELDDLDLVITVTEQQEVNIIATAYLKSRGVNRAIALVSGTGYAAIARQRGVDVVVSMKQVVVDLILSHVQGGGVKGVHRIRNQTFRSHRGQAGYRVPLFSGGLHIFGAVVYHGGYA